MSRRENRAAPILLGGQLVLIVAALSFFPALALGPIADHFSL